MLFIITITIVSMILGVLFGIKIEKYFSLKRPNPKDTKYKKSYCDMAVLVKVRVSKINDALIKMVGSCEV